MLNEMNLFLFQGGNLLRKIKYNFKTKLNHCKHPQGSKDYNLQYETTVNLSPRGTQNTTPKV